jgi:ABC-type transport system involved in multi-copper enzyme maturation permease subunit
MVVFGFVVALLGCVFLGISELWGETFAYSWVAFGIGIGIVLIGAGSILQLLGFSMPKEK